MRPIADPSLVVIWGRTGNRFMHLGAICRFSRRCLRSVLTLVRFNIPMCERLEEHFVAALEDESPPGFAEHLADCPRCQNDLERLTLLDKELKKTLAVPANLFEIWRV